MREIIPSHVKEFYLLIGDKLNTKKAACSFRMFERSCLWQRRLFTFVRHYASHEVSCGMLPKVCKALINYLKHLCFLHYPLSVWSHIFTGCSQGGKVTFGNTLCTFKTRTHRHLKLCRLSRIYIRVGACVKTRAYVFAQISLKLSHRIWFREMCVEKMTLESILVIVGPRLRPCCF